MNSNYGIINSKIVIITESVTYTFLFPDVKFTYEVAKATKENPSKASSEIVGISMDTFLAIKRASGTKYMEIYDGIDGELFLTFTGVIEEVKYLFDKGNQKLSITANKSSEKAEVIYKSISLSPSNLRTTITTIGGQYGYKIIFPEKDDLSGIQCGKFCATGSCMDAISSILPPNYSYSVGGDEIHIYKDKSTLSGKDRIYLNFANGLLEYPLKEIDKNQDATTIFYTIKTKYIPQITEGVTLLIPTDKGWYSSMESSTNAEFVVRRYSISFTDGKYDITYECDGVSGMID